VDRRGTIGKFIGNALGRETGAADRAYVDAVHETAEAREYSLRAAVVTHREGWRK